MVRQSALLAAGLVALGLEHVRAQDEFIITDDTYFYGQSEPVYPARESASNQPQLSPHEERKFLLTSMAHH